jgi:hypothetical protein
MAKISSQTLAEVKNALKRYEDEVNESNLELNTKKTYLRHSMTFVRWIDDDFTPGDKT